jgi:hypothetical protein
MRLAPGRSSQEVLRAIQAHYEREQSSAVGRALFTICWGGNEVVWLSAAQFTAWLRTNLGVWMEARELEDLARSLPTPPPVSLPAAPQPPQPPPPTRGARISFRRLRHVFH